MVFITEVKAILTNEHSRNMPRRAPDFSLLRDPSGFGQSKFLKLIRASDRDKTLKTKPRLSVGLTSRDETSNFETRPRRDVCRLRDMTEKLK